MSKGFYIWKILAGFILLVSPAIAQPIEPQQIPAQIQEARVFESQNDLQNAVRICQNLYTQYPNRQDIASYLEHLYSRTGQHLMTIDLLRRTLERSPSDLPGRLRLADALYAAGKRDTAFMEWDRILQNTRTPNVFGMVADKYIQNNLFERATATYDQARRALGSPDLFSRERAELSERQTHYTEAVRDYLLYVRQKPQYRSLIEARLRDMAQNGDQQSEIVDLLAAAVGTPPKSDAMGLLVAYGLPAGYAARVLEIVKEAPGQDASQLAYFSRIAQYAHDAKDFETAAAAYHTLFDRVPRPDVRAGALMGLARASEGLGQFDQARQHYQAVLSQFAARPEADEARFHLGRFQRDLDHDPERARQTFLELIASNRRSTWRIRACFELAEGYLLADQFDEAEKVWSRVLAEMNTGAEAAQARFQIAEGAYYRGDFEKAKILLVSILARDLAQNVANDAITRLALIEEGERTSPEQLLAFAQAERMRRQMKPKAANSAFEDMQKQFPQSFLTDRILYQRAELLEELKAYTEAIQHYRKLIATQGDSPLCPASQMAMARIYELRLRQYHDAQSAYELLLVTYPMSLEADIAREKLRAMQQKIRNIEAKKETG
ncbi:MAG: tetratricopeptide repeat protein [bacterium]|nr:tetratricopeptide repeat protein [bacterium]